MRRRRDQVKHPSRERWLVSYADLVTLLLAFFVVLYASSQVDKAKMNRMAAAIEGAFRQLGALNGDGATFDAKPSIAVPPAHVADDTANQRMAAQNRNALSAELAQLLSAEIARQEVALRIGPEGLVISLREVGFFDSGSAELRPAAQPAIARIANVLRSRAVRVRVEGHTDDVPIHTRRFDSNWELSTARAVQMVRTLISAYELSPERLSAAGFGEFHPVATNDTEDGRRKNRRVDLVILDGYRIDEATRKSPEVHPHANP